MNEESLRIESAVQKARGLSPVWPYGADFDPWRRYLVTLEWQLALQLDARRRQP